VDATLKKLDDLFTEDSVWFGDTPPLFQTYLLKLDSTNNFRAPAERHNNYSVVWVYERELFANKSWPLLIDEAISLLRERGKLVCRSIDCWGGSIVELKSYLFRRPDIKVELLRQFKTDAREIICEFAVERIDLMQTQSRNWTIGILSNGKKNANVAALINKIMQLANGKKVEFIVAGDFDPNLTNHPELVCVFDLGCTDNLPRIAEKKLKISQQAKHENIAIFHDRYQVEDNFFLGFDRFGYSFSLVAVNQSCKNGDFFPGYAATGFPGLRCLVAKYSKKPGHLIPGHYVNGGLMIIKKSILDKISFNPLLLHNEAEDVELSYLFSTHGLVPRLNIYSSAVTFGIRSGYMAGFTEVPDSFSSVSCYPFIIVWVDFWRRLPKVLSNRLGLAQLFAKIHKLWC
jgi:hypothetical protein